MLSIFLAACGSSGGGSGGAATGKIFTYTFDSDAVGAVVDFGGTQYTVGAGGALALDFSTIPEGMFTEQLKITAGGSVAQGAMHGYSQQYSVVFGHGFNSDPDEIIVNDRDELNWFAGAQTSGIKTTTDQINGIGNQVFSYTGSASNFIAQGTLGYSIDFGTRMGSGSITGIGSLGTIALGSASLSNTGRIDGTASAGGGSTSYWLELFGPNAEEIAGAVDTHKPGLELDQIVFAGKR